MCRTALTPTILIITMVALSLAPASNILSAAQAEPQQVITDDGREVLLMEDGTWIFRSTDRFTNTKDGRRVRLKDDGSWHYTVNAEMSSKEHVRTTNLDIKLQKVVIEIQKKKVIKNTRIKTQTVFYLSLKNSPLSKRNVNIKEHDTSMIIVRDNSGKHYPVLSIQPGPAILEPDSNATLIIRADGSPSFFDNVKSMEIVFKPGIFGIQKTITFSEKFTDVEEKNVDGFEKIE